MPEHDQMCVRNPVFFFFETGKAPIPTSCSVAAAIKSERTQKPILLPSVINVAANNMFLLQQEEKAQVLTSKPNSLGFIVVIKRQATETRGWSN